MNRYWLNPHISENPNLSFLYLSPHMVNNLDKLPFDISAAKKILFNFNNCHDFWQITYEQSLRVNEIFGTENIIFYHRMEDLIYYRGLYPSNCFIFYQALPQTLISSSSSSQTLAPSSLSQALALSSLAIEPVIPEDKEKKKKVYKKKNEVKSNIKKECVICFDELEVEVSFNPCGHTLFHQKCITKATKNNMRCPICRTDGTIVKLYF